MIDPVSFTKVCFSTISFEQHASIRSWFKCNEYSDSWLFNLDSKCKHSLSRIIQNKMNTGYTRASSGTRARSSWTAFISCQDAVKTTQFYFIVFNLRNRGGYRCPKLRPYSFRLMGWRWTTTKTTIDSDRGSDEGNINLVRTVWFILIANFNMSVFIFSASFL